MERISDQKVKRLKIGIWTLSIVIPVVVAVLFGVKLEGYDTRFLPPIYATINAITSVVLIAALIAIRQKRKDLHQRFMQLAVVCSLLFLVGYVAYHMTSDPTKYEGNATLVYYLLLISHIILSITVVPLVLVTYLYAYLGEFERHKKLAKFTFPIWLYVAVSGVIVYLMISPYYG